MNILIDNTPTSVKIENKFYKINSNFRNSILFEMMMQDPELTDEEKVINALNLYYPIIPLNEEKAIESIMWFYSCGKDIDKSNKKRNGGSVNNKIYDYEFDDDYIYSAFLSQYGIDLQDIEYLHWWKFKAMFKALKEDNMIVKIMGYRGIDISKIKDKEQRLHYKRLKDMYKIPDNVSKTEKEKMNSIEEALMKNGNLSDIL